MKVDSSVDTVCLGYNSKRLNKEIVFASDLGGINRDTTTFFLIHRTVTRKINHSLTGLNHLERIHMI